MWKHDIGQNTQWESLEVCLNDLEKQPTGLHSKAVPPKAVFISGLPWKETDMLDQYRKRRASVVVSAL